MRNNGAFHRTKAGGVTAEGAAQPEKKGNLFHNIPFFMPRGKGLEPVGSGALFAAAQKGGAGEKSWWGCLFWPAARYLRQAAAYTGEKGAIHKKEPGVLSNVTKQYLCRFYEILDEMILGMTGAELTDSISHNFIVPDDPPPPGGH